MYYPKSKILEAQFTSGKEFVFKETNKYYNGYYCKLSDGRFLTGKTISNQSKEIIKLTDLNQNKKITINTGLSLGTPNLNVISTYSKIINSDIKEIANQIDLKNYNPQPTQDDYKNNFIIRYFAKKLNIKEINIIEINFKDYDSVLNKEGKYYNIYQVISLSWKIAGPERDDYSNKTQPVYGIVDTNQRTLNKKEFEMPGIKKYLSNLKEFTKF